MSMRNSNGSSTEPWGTPESTCLGVHSCDWGVIRRWFTTSKTVMLKLKWTCVFVNLWNFTGMTDKKRITCQTNFKFYQIRARHLFFPQLVRRTTTKQYGLVRNRNLLGHDRNILRFSKKKIWENCISVYSFFISRLLCLKHTVTY